ncbi:PTS sugar transporter subunit IIA [Treponema pectinovorum]|uniref:PTS sugar transporter subunit IIA n=1 Tax=Treponema pectinovorum TaxID=164 RepID=UPI0011C8E963|nr:PTS sugar transporter subunit IIA [Treponema pectinovorum]
MVLEDIFTKDCIIVDLQSTEKDELFEEMVEKLYSIVPDFNREEVLFALNEREAKMSTGIMHSVAIPHAFVSSINGTFGVIGISRDGIDYDSLDRAPVHVVFMLLAGEGQTEKHVQVLKSLAILLQKKDFVKNIISCKTQSEVYNLIVQSEDVV